MENRQAVVIITKDAKEITALFDKASQQVELVNKTDHWTKATTISMSLEALEKIVKAFSEKNN